MGRAFRKTLYLLQEFKGHLELLLGCEHYIPGSESLGEQEEWTLLKNHSKTFRWRHTRFPCVQFNWAQAHFLEPLRHIPISAVFAICLALCICVCVWTNVYLYFRMFSNKAMLVQSTLSKQPWQLCYFARLMPAISKAFLGTLLETGFKHQLKRPLCRSSSLLLNCRRLQRPEAGWHAGPALHSASGTPISRSRAHSEGLAQGKHSLFCPWFAPEPQVC